MPQNIGRFQVLRILGRGAQSVVYLAHGPQLQCEAAIKTMHFAQPEDRDLKIGALIQESRTVSRLQHPNPERALPAARAAQSGRTRLQANRLGVSP